MIVQNEININSKKNPLIMLKGYRESHFKLFLYH